MMKLLQTKSTSLSLIVANLARMVSILVWNNVEDSNKVLYNHQMVHDIRNIDLLDLMKRTV